MSHPKEDPMITPAAAALAGAAPEAWSNFKAAFRKYAEHRRDLCISAEAHNVQKSQGYALQCVELQALFDDALPAVTRMNARNRT